jgi:ribose transport system substrate-binding protein
MSYPARFTRIAIAGAATLLAATAAACGSSASTGSTSSSPSSSSSSALSAATISTLQAKLNSYQAVPKFVAPGPAINVKNLQGKSVYVIPENGNSFNNSIIGVMKSIATQAGIKMTVYENSGVSSQYVQGMQSAIAQKPSLIILANAPDPRGLQPQIAAAKAAGIPVEVTHFYDDSTPRPPACAGCAAGVTSLETAKFNLTAELMADWIILHSNGRADVLIPILLGVIPTPGMEATFKAQFSKYCPSCKTKYVNVPAAAFGTSDFSNSIEASISGDPQLDWILEQFDPVVPSIVSAIATAGRAGKINVVSYAGDTAVLAEMQSNSGVAMDVGESQPWIAYSTMDQAFRTILGQPAPVESSPLRIFDAANVSEAGTPPATTSGYGNSYASAFMSLWGLK